MLLCLLNDNEYTYKIYTKNDSLFTEKVSQGSIDYLGEEKTKNIIRYLFDGKMKYLSRSNGYEIYLDEAGNKRFFKNGKENFKMFFHLNGEDAISYKGKKGIVYRTRRFIFVHKKTMYLVCSLLFFAEFHFLFADVRSPVSNVFFDIKDKTHYVLVGDYKSDNLIDYIKNSNGDHLDEIKKEFFANKAFIEDIITYGDSDKISSYIEKLENFNIEYFEDDYKEKTSNIGEYRPLEVNKIYLYDDSVKIFNMAAAHEFVHLMQQNFKYPYIREASAEMMAWEYFGSKPTAYYDQIKRVCLLTDIIGADLMFEANFNMSTQNFDDEIKNLLGEEDGTKLLSLFDKIPSNNDNIEEINKQVDKFLFKMYKIKYGEEAFEKNVPCILNMYSNSYIENYHQNRFYFNRHDYRYYKNEILDYSDQDYSKVNLNNIDEEEIEKIFLKRFYPINKEEYERHEKYNMDYYEYEEAAKGYDLLPDGAVINKKNNEVICKEEAEKNNLVHTNFGFLIEEELSSISDIPEELNFCENCYIVLKDGSIVRKNWMGVYKIDTSKDNFYHLLDHIDYDSSTSKKISM